MKKPISVPISDRGLLTVLELSAALRKRPAAVRALAQRREIAYYRVGRAMLFDPQDVEVFLAGCRRPARGEKAIGTNPRSALS